MSGPQPGCECCLKYRKRIHQLAGDLDKERSRRIDWELQRERCQDLARKSLRHVYGRNWYLNNSWNDRHLIGLGLRTLINVGIDRRTSVYGFRGRPLLTLKWFLLERCVGRFLRYLVGIPVKARN